MLEYYATLPAWATFTVHRKSDDKMLMPQDLMLLRKSRLESEPQQKAPSPRYKQPGERPPLTGPTVDPALLAPPRKANLWPMPVN